MTVSDAAESGTISNAQPRSRREELLHRFEELTEWPLLLLALAMVPMLLAPLVTDVSSGTNGAIETTLWVIWGVFAVELGIRTYLSERRLNYLLRHWYDVLIVVIPFLRPLRVARSARALRLLRISRVAPAFIRAWADGAHILKHRSLHLVLLSGMLAVLGCAGLVLAFERNGNGTIDDYGTALWWAMTTVTTVGYGDTFPTTPEGKGVAIVLMLIGISFFSWITANIAAFLVEFGGGEEHGVTTHDLMLKLDQMEAEIKALRAGHASSPAAESNGAGLAPVPPGPDIAVSPPTSDVLPGP
jgi:voltage-gated potassium channel